MYTASNNINIAFERYILLTVEHFWLVSLLKDRTVDINQLTLDDDEIPDI